MSVDLISIESNCFTFSLKKGGKFYLTYSQCETFAECNLPVNALILNKHCYKTHLIINYLTIGWEHKIFM